MCTIRRARIKKLIKQQRKGKSKGDLLLINIDALPLMCEGDLKKAFELLNTRGVLIHEWKPAVQIIKTTRPRKI
jgi:hypothetical protein